MILPTQKPAPFAPAQSPLRISTTRDVARTVAPDRGDSRTGSERGDLASARTGSASPRDRRADREGPSHRPLLAGARSEPSPVTLAGQPGARGHAAGAGAGSPTPVAVPLVTTACLDGKTKSRTSESAPHGGVGADVARAGGVAGARMRSGTTEPEPMRTPLDRPLIRLRLKVVGPAPRSTDLHAHIICAPHRPAYGEVGLSFTSCAHSHPRGSVNSWR